MKYLAYQYEKECGSLVAEKNVPSLSATYKYINIYC